MTNSEVSGPPSSRVVKVVVATTVMLSFISFWRAAAIVLSDLASSAYYAGGIAETAISKEDVVVVSVHLASPAGSGEHDLRKDQVLRSAIAMWSVSPCPGLTRNFTPIRGSKFSMRSVAKLWNKSTI